MQALEAVQEMLENELVPVGLGNGNAIGSIDQLFPFQTSARVASTANLSLYHPTAMQASAVVQETLERDELFDCAGFGVGTTDHVVPFQDSARVAGSLYPFKVNG